MKIIAIFALVAWAAFGAAAETGVPFVVQESIEAGQLITEWISKAADRRQFPEMLVRIPGLLSKFLKGLGPAVKLWMAVFPGDNTHEKQVMRKLAEINDQLRQLSQQIKDLEAKIEWEHTAQGYTIIEDRLTELSIKLNAYYEEEDEERRAFWKKEFEEQYERYEKDGNLYKLFFGITKNDSDPNRNLIRAFARASEYHRGNVSIFSTNVLKLFIQGIELHIAYLTMTGTSDNIVDGVQSDWDEKQREAVQEMSSHDSWVMSEANSYVYRDFDKHIGSGSSAAANIFNFLKEKYYWGDIIVHSAVKRWDFGWHKFGPCNGRTKQFSEGSSIRYVNMVAFLKNETSEMDICNQHLNWLHSKHNEKAVTSAKRVFNNLMDRVSSSCFSPFSLVDLVGYSDPGSQRGYSLYTTNAARVRTIRIFYFFSGLKHSVTAVC